MSDVGANEVNAFAHESRRFVRWARGETEEGMDAATALLRVVSLYAMGFRLSSAFSEPLAKDSDTDVSKDEWRLVFERSSQLPLRYYGEVFDPLQLPPEEPVVGDVADDIADIYRDVARGLKLFDAGDEHGARWEWGFNFQIHWGEHATGAIRALHAYVVSENAYGS